MSIALIYLISEIVTTEKVISLELCLGAKAMMLKLTSDYSLLNSLQMIGVDADGTLMMKVYQDSGDTLISPRSNYATHLMQLYMFPQLILLP